MWNSDRTPEARQLAVVGEMNLGATQMAEQL